MLVELLGLLLPPFWMSRLLVDFFGSQYLTFVFFLIFVIVISLLLCFWVSNSGFFHDCD